MRTVADVPLSRNGTSKPSRWNWDDREANPALVPPDLIEGLVPQQTVSVIQGQAKSMKTTLLKALAVAAIQQDGRLFGPGGLAICGGPYHFVHVNEDMPAERLVERMWHGIGAFASPHRERLSYFHMQGFRLNSDAGVGRLIEAIARDHSRPEVADLPLVVGIDSITNIAGTDDENDNANRKLVFGRVKRLVTELGATVLLIAHESYGQKADTIRGAKSVYEDVDVALRLRRVPGVGFEISVRESRWYDKAEAPVMTIAAIFDPTAGEHGTITLRPSSAGGERLRGRQAEGRLNEIKVLAAFDEIGATAKRREIVDSTALPERTCGEALKRLKEKGEIHGAGAGSYTRTESGLQRLNSEARGAQA